MGPRMAEMSPWCLQPCWELAENAAPGAGGELLTGRSPTQLHRSHRGSPCNKSAEQPDARVQKTQQRNTPKHKTKIQNTTLPYILPHIQELASN